MRKVLLLLFGLLQLLSVHGQSNGFLLKGKVSDALTHDPLPKASVYLNESLASTLTAADGSFQMKIPKTPAVLVVSCVGYARKYMTLPYPQSTVLEVQLEPSLLNIPEVEISARRKAIPISEDQDIYVVDYDFYDDQILLLGHPGKKSLQTELILMDPMGKRILQKDISKGQNLYRDPFNNLHLLTSDTAYQLYYDGKDIQLLYPCSKDQFMDLFPEFLELYHDKIILRQYAFEDQALLYYFYLPKDSTLQRFWSSATPEVYNKTDGLMGNIPITKNGKSTSHFNLFNADERFVKMAFYSPIFCPLEVLHDTIYIFNFTEGLIQTYGARGFAVESPTTISFHKTDTWKKRLYHDRVTDKIYTEFLNKGISELREINVKTGELTNQKIKIPDFPFISKLLVNNGYLYFLYEEKEYPNFMRLYRMVIGQ